MAMAIPQELYDRVIQHASMIAADVSAKYDTPAQVILCFSLMMAILEHAAGDNEKTFDKLRAKTIERMQEYPFGTVSDIIQKRDTGSTIN